MINTGDCPELKEPIDCADSNDCFRDEIAHRLIIFRAVGDWASFLGTHRGHNKIYIGNTWETQVNHGYHNMIYRIKTGKHNRNTWETQGNTGAMTRYTGWGNTLMQFGSIDNEGISYPSCPIQIRRSHPFLSARKWSHNKFKLVPLEFKIRYCLLGFSTYMLNCWCLNKDNKDKDHVYLVQSLESAPSIVGVESPGSAVGRLLTPGKLDKKWNYEGRNSGVKMWLTRFCSHLHQHHFSLRLVPLCASWGWCQPVYSPPHWKNFSMKNVKVVVFHHHTVL